MAPFWNKPHEVMGKEKAMLAEQREEQARALFEFRKSLAKLAEHVGNIPLEQSIEELGKGIGGVAHEHD